MKDGWKIVTLGNLVTFERGLTYSKGDEVASSTIGVLRSNNVDLATHTLNLDEIRYLRSDFEVPSNKRVRKSSLLMCMSNGSKDHLGKVALIDSDIDYAFGGFMGLLIPNESLVLAKYLYYALTSKSFKDYIHSLSDGANINNLKYKDLSSFEIHLPSLSEQQQIVDNLEHGLAKVDELKVIAGKNFEHSIALLQSALKQSLLPKDSWSKSTLVDVVKIINGRAYSKDELLNRGKYRVLRVGNFFTNDSWYFSDLELDDDKYCEKGDLLYAWSASFGPKIWDGEKVIYHYHIWKVQPTEQIDKKFLFYWLQSCYLTSQVMSRLHGTTMVHITKGIMESTVLQYPSLTEQRTIASTLDALFSKCQLLKEDYAKTLALCDDLKHSILRRAINSED